MDFILIQPLSVSVMQLMEIPTEASILDKDLQTLNTMVKKDPHVIDGMW